jgi:hypothetical protein
VLRDGARRMLQQVIEAEVETFVAAYAEHQDEGSRRRVVRNGCAPEREIQTGSARSPNVGRSFATVATVPAASASDSPRRCCRHSCGGPGKSRNCSRGST